METPMTLPGQLKTVLRYSGAKWRLAKWLRCYVPPHTTYIEPYAGSLALFFTKQPAEYEIVNDLDGAVVNLFRVIREQGRELARAVAMTPWSREEFHASTIPSGSDLEDARRFLVRCWQAYGARLNEGAGWKRRIHASSSSSLAVWNHLPERIVAVVGRLKQAEIESQPALKLIARFRDESDALIYADPPYLLDTRNNSILYRYEMSTEDHLQLLEALTGHKGSVLLSGYAHQLYDTRLAHWMRVTTPSVADGGRPRTEVLWINPHAARLLAARQAQVA